jgi:hypothetical protein
MDAQASLGACAGVLVMYNVLALALRRASGLTLMLASGRQWTHKHVSGRSATDVTLAVQTLRNTVLVATFVGTLSFTVAGATLGAAAAADGAAPRARAVLQAALLTGSFLNFALVIRCAAHAGYLIGSLTAQPQAAAAAEQSRAAEEGEGAERADAPADPLHEVTTLLHMQAVHFSLGFRFFYTSIPFAFAVVGTEALIIATCAIVAFLVYIDHALYIWGRCAMRGAVRLA